jgi:hypothetical protein
MSPNRAPRHLSLLLVLGVAGALGACASKQQTPTGTAATIQGGIKVDPTRCDPRGKQVVTADTNQDKKVDVTKLYEVRDKGGQKEQILACKQVDINYDDKVDIVYHYDQAGTLSFEEFDLDFDNRYDLWTYYQAGVKIREEKDMNYDGRADYTEIYEGGKKARVERDSNYDGKIDQWEYYENDKLDRIGYDTSGAGRADKWDRAPESETGAATAEAAPPTAAAPPTTGAAPPPAPPAPAPAAPAPAKR